MSSEDIAFYIVQFAYIVGILCCALAILVGIGILK